jgi:hypothetical protein
MSSAHHAFTVSSVRPWAKSGTTRLLPVGATFVGALVAAASFSDIDPQASGPLGLISALPLSYFGGVGLVIAAFVAVLSRDRLSRPLLVAQMTVTVALLYGVASYTEDIARLPTTWVHVGFVDYIQRQGDVLHGYDARFAWAGFFTSAAMLNQLAGEQVQPVVYAWTPLALNLAFLVPVWLIAQSAGASVRTAWLATMLFALTNWVGQDYYSPQGVNFLLALGFLAVLLRVFSHDSRLFSRLFRGRLKNVSVGGSDVASTTPRQRALLVVALSVVFGASVASHQLTPFFLIVITLGLVLLDRVSVRTLPVFMLLAVFMWITYAATSFWSGQIQNIFGDVGQVGGVVDESVNNRVTGDPDHLPVIYGRLALAVAVWGAAATGFVRRLRQGHLDIVCVVGFIAPFSVLGGQAYGGEAMLRVYLFALPFAVTLAAQALSPLRGGWSVKRTVVVGAICAVLVPVYFVTRYGNEAFEQFQAGELQLVDDVYAVAPTDSLLMALNSLAPTRGKNIENLEFRSVAEDGPPADNVAALEAKMAEVPHSHAYLLVTRAQSEYAQLTHGRSASWTADFVDDVLATERYRVLFENADGVVIVPVGQGEA